MRSPFMIDSRGAFGIHYFPGSSISFFLLSAHHIGMDMLSFKIFYSEYSSTVTLVRPIVQYIDYAYWNRALQFHGYVSDSLDFWRMKLALAGTRILDLPLDKARPPEFSFEGNTVQGCQSIAALQRILKCRALLSGSAFDVLLAGLTILLGHLSGQHDIFFGVPYHGRDHPNLFELCGYFIVM
jgi:hypothetical protein